MMVLDRISYLFKYNLRICTAKTYYGMLLAQKKIQCAQKTYPETLQKY